MECKQPPFEFLCELFPQIDIRLIRATVLEHGDDFESAIDFLVDNSDQIKDASYSDVFKQKYFVAWDGIPEQSPSEVTKETDFSKLRKAEQTRDLLSLVGALTVKEFEHPKDEQARDFLSLVGAHTENAAEVEETPVLDDPLNRDNKSSQLSVASVGGSSFDDRKDAFTERKLSSPRASTSSSILGRVSNASDPTSSVSSSDLLERLSKLVCINGGCIEGSPRVLGEEIINGGYNSETEMPSWIGLKGMGLPSDVSNDQAELASENLFGSNNISHSCHGNASPAGIISSTSCQNVSVEFLEDFVHEARTDKEILMQFVETISTLRAKADQESIAAQRSKMDAVRGGQDILVKAEEMRKQTSKIRDDNLMRAGEIYGEKAILSTEARELLFRLEQLKQEKEKAVSTLCEIEAALQARLNMAIEEQERADVEKKLKEENALKILAMEEALLTTVIKESKDLDVEAEACTQLRGFLIEHGRIVDSLQGEMGILCEDVESFKKQVEEGMWSTVSTVNFPSGVTPEGPYSFRRSNRSPSSSSEDLLPKGLHEIDSDVKGSAQFLPPKEWNEETHASDCTNSYGSSNPKFYEGLPIDFVPSVLEPSFDPIMPEPSFDVSEIKGREYDLDTDQLKSVVGSSGDLELDVISNGGSNCWNGSTNNVFDMKQLLSNKDMHSDVDQLNFEHPGVQVPFSDIPNKPSSEKGSKKESDCSCNSSHSDDNDWDMLCMEP